MRLTSRKYLLPITYVHITKYYYNSCLVFLDSSESGSNKCSGRTGSDGPGNSRLGSAGKGSSDGKPTRVRTVLNEKQLHTLRTCYSANPRPDALMKEQLVEMTGLSPRVIRVWFQNKRCKDKKRAIALKQQIQQDKVRAPKRPKPIIILVSLSSALSSQFQSYILCLWRLFSSNEFDINIVGKTHKKSTKSCNEPA